MSRLILPIIALLLMVPATYGQSELAAVLEVINAGVEVRRVNTANFLPVTAEAIVGVGDAIRTDATGTARVTFFADGVETVLQPNTEVQINAFNEGLAETSFELTFEVLAGQTSQRLDRALDATSNYDVVTPGMTLAARGTAFDIRVEADGRSAMLVTEGMVAAIAGENEDEVGAEFGIRSAVNEALSDVVRANTFAELDSALDGCSAGVSIPGDVRINVRTGPSLDFPRVGTVADDDIDLFIGVSESGMWYRFDFRGGFGWVQASQVTIEDECAGLREFADNHGPEDISLYEFIGDPIEVDPVQLAPSADEGESDATEATPEDDAA